MKKLVIFFGAMVCFSTVDGMAQQKSAAAGKPSPGHAAAAKSPAKKQSPASSKATPAGSPAAGQSTDIFGGGSGDSRPKGPTEITATQEAQFDTRTRTGVFIGNVKVIDPQFTLTSNQLTVHLNKDEEGGGLNDAEAQGNVVIVHVNQPKVQPGAATTPGTATPGAATTPGPAATPGAATTPGVAPTPAAAAPGVPPPGAAQAPASPTSVGKADKAHYDAKDGSVTLTGWPQVTQGGNTHIATAPGVKMVLFKDGRMQTYGATRTLIEDRTTATKKPNANGAQ